MGPRVAILHRLSDSVPDWSRFGWNSKDAFRIYRKMPGWNRIGQLPVHDQSWFFWHVPIFFFLKEISGFLSGRLPLQFQSIKFPDFFIDLVMIDTSVQFCVHWWNWCRGLFFFSPIFPDALFWNSLLKWLILKLNGQVVVPFPGTGPWDFFVRPIVCPTGTPLLNPFTTNAAVSAHLEVCHAQGQETRG